MAVVKNTKKHEGRCRGNSKWGTLKWTIAAFCVSLVVFIGAAAFFIVNKKSGKAETETLNQVSMETTQQIWKNLRDAALATFSHVDDDFALELNNPLSAEWKALQWIILNDNFVHSSSAASSDKLLQRYAMTITWIHFDLTLEPDKHECNWIGVGCSLADVIISLNFTSVPTLGVAMPRAVSYLQSIESLDFSKLGLKGTIPPPCYKQWGKLRVLNLAENQLTSFFTGLSLESMGELEVLNLRNNFLDERVTEAISGLKKMQRLDVKGNEKLTGPLMEYVVPSWTKIESLVLTRSALTGSIPDYVGNGSMRYLSELIADYTLLSGSLPESLSYASNLRILSLGSLETTWTGTLPSSYDKLTSLEFVSFTDFQGINGTLPASWGSAWGLIVALDIWGVPQLTGTLPPEWSGMKELSILNLIENRLTGTIPTEFGRLTRLNELALYKSRLEGTMPKEVCALRTSHGLVKLFSDCKMEGLNEGEAGMQCMVPDCCTFCSASFDPDTSW